LESLQTRLAKHDQWLPIDGDPTLPLCKLIETNSSGPLRLGFGAWRDLLLGMQFTTKSGQLITAGGRTMKNVAGYDLTKFMVGQYGIFGKIETITMRTYKRPTAALLVKTSIWDTLIGKLLPTDARPQWAMIAQGFNWLGYLGDDHAIAFQESNIRKIEPIEVKRQSPTDDIEFRARRWLPVERPPLHFRASVPTTRMTEFVRRTEVADFAADPAFGIVVGACVVHRKDVLRDIAKSMNGSIVFDDKDDLNGYFGAAGTELLLMRALQSAFDQ
jgi:hypothetical protein